MKDIDIFKKMKKYSKLSLIFTILVFTISILSFAIIPAILIAIGEKNPWNRLENNESLDFFFVSLLTISGIIIIIFSILIFVYNILTIIKTCSLEESKDKTLLIVMSILGLIWLGMISNIIILIIANSNIKILSKQQENIAKENTQTINNVSNEVTN